MRSCLESELNALKLLQAETAAELDALLSALLARALREALSPDEHL